MNDKNKKIPAARRAGGYSDRKNNPEKYGIRDNSGRPAARHVKSERPDREEPVPEVDGDSDKLEGRNPVLEALRSGRDINKIWILEPADGKKLDPLLMQIYNQAKAKGVVITRVPRTTLDRMSSTHNHQGVIAQAASHEYVSIDDILKKAEDAGHAPLIVVLDELKDAYNLGSILRISDAAGVDGVIIPKHRSIGLDSMVAKASAGAIEYVPVARVTNLSQTLSELKEKGFWVCGTAMDGASTYDEADLTGPLAIVIGSEGDGMRETVRKSCDFLIQIPMVGHVNSLNAAVAAGIIVFEAAKKRR